MNPIVDPDKQNEQSLEHILTLRQRMEEVVTSSSEISEILEQKLKIYLTASKTNMPSVAMIEPILNSYNQLLKTKMDSVDKIIKSHEKEMELRKKYITDEAETDMLKLSHSALLSMVEKTIRGKSEKPAEQILEAKI